MPHSEIHKKKRKKNFALLALIFVWCFLIYALSIVKMAHSEAIPNKYKVQRETHQTNMDELDGIYTGEQAETHQEGISSDLESWWYGDQMSEQAREIKILKKGGQFDWETDEDFQERMGLTEE
jgi:hypothetical protein